MRHLRAPTRRLLIQPHLPRRPSFPFQQQQHHHHPRFLHLPSPFRRSIFQYFWRPKPTTYPPPSPTSPDKQDTATQGQNDRDCPHPGLPLHPPYDGDYDNEHHHPSLWGAKTGHGSQQPYPPCATESLMEKLNKAHECTQTLLKHTHKHPHTHPTQPGGTAAMPSPSVIHTLHELIDNHWRFRLERRPSTLPDGGLGLFLTQGQLQQGEVITLYPGLIYKIPYDLERAMDVDEISFTPCPPPFVLKNDYLLRFHHKPTNQHLLLDGCPRGISALNFIRTNQHRAKLGANMDWLESTGKACGKRPVVCAGVGECGDGGFVMVPDFRVEASRWFSTNLGLGHMTNRSHAGGRRGRGKEGKEMKEKRQRKPDPHTHTDHHHLDDEQEQKKSPLEGLRFNDSRDPATHNAEFHLYELPLTLPPHLLRFIPTLHVSDALGEHRFCVLVTASKDIHVPTGAAPVEIFVPYHSHLGVCKHGFPLL